LNPFPPDKRDIVTPLRALSIRQPFAELILRGIKTIEYRSRTTRITVERFYIYASKSAGKKIFSNDLDLENPPPWIAELANAMKLFPSPLPTGVIVGSAVISRVLRGEHAYEWHLADVERIARPRKPTAHPQPVWFLPFGRN